MLVLTRRINETIIIGDDIYITILQVKGNQIRIGIKAPRETKILREELLSVIAITNASQENAPLPTQIEGESNGRTIK